MRSKNDDKWQTEVFGRKSECCCYESEDDSTWNLEKCLSSRKVTAWLRSSLWQVLFVCHQNFNYRIKVVQAVLASIQFQACSFRSNYSRLNHIMKLFRVRLIELRLFRKKRESANWHTKYFPPVRTKRLAAIIIGRKMRVFRVVKEAPDQWPFLISICYH